MVQEEPVRKGGGRRGVNRRQVSPNPGHVFASVPLWPRLVDKRGGGGLPAGGRGSWRGALGPSVDTQTGARDPLWFLPFCPALLTDPPDGARSAAEESSVP